MLLWIKQFMGNFSLACTKKIYLVSSYVSISNRRFSRNSNISACRFWYSKIRKYHVWATYFNVNIMLEYIFIIFIIKFIVIGVIEELSQCTIKKCSKSWNNLFISYDQWLVTFLFLYIRCNIFSEVDGFHRNAIN